MNFDQKINALMHLFKISNSKLSRGIGVDASLISRWKSGERKISQNSPHIPMLANFFLKINAYHYQKEYLERIIAARLPEKQRQDEASRIHVLADWLISAEPPDPQPDEQPEQLAQSFSLIANISSLLTGSEPARPFSPAAGGIAVAEGISEYAINPAKNEECQLLELPGRSRSYEIFEGRAGKRQAVINFLCYALNSEQKLDILLTSEDDTRWITEDRNFAATWARLLRMVIEKGHQITLIHVVNRRINEIMNMLFYWMPLHMAGHMNSYYYPRYGDRRIRQTLFIIRGKVAVISSTIADYGGEELFYRFDDPATVEQYTRLFMVHLSQCRPLFAVYAEENKKAFYEQIIDLNKKPGAVYNIRHQLNIRLLPLPLLKHYLSSSKGYHSGQQMTDWLLIQQQDFYCRLENESYIDIMPLSLLDQIQERKPVYLASCEVFAEAPIAISPADTLTWLQQIVAALQKYPNYELYLCTDNSAIDSLLINITYKENVVALFSPAGRESNNSSTILLSENNILHSLSYYFDDFIQQIPTALRNRADVVQRLQRLIASLSDTSAEWSEPNGQ